MEIYEVRTNNNTSAFADLEPISIHLFSNKEESILIIGEQ